MNALFTVSFLLFALKIAVRQRFRCFQLLTLSELGKPINGISFLNSGVGERERECFQQNNLSHFGRAPKRWLGSDSISILFPATDITSLLLSYVNRGRQLIQSTKVWDLAGPLALPLLFIANRSSSISNVLIPIIEKAFGNRIEFPSKKREKEEKKKTKKGKTTSRMLLVYWTLMLMVVGCWYQYTTSSKENITLILTSSFFLRGVVLLYKRGRSRIWNLYGCVGTETWYCANCILMSSIEYRITFEIRSLEQCIIEVWEFL